MSRRISWTILAIGAFLRLFQIWTAGLWYDENFSLLLSRLPFTTMIAATMGDVHPPLYYILLWPIGQIANLPAWAIRIPSALFSIIALALFPRLLERLMVPKNVQILAFAMLAFLPMQLHYAQEARMYALLEMLMVLGVLAVLEDRPWLLGTVTAALLYTQNYGLFYAATLGILALINFDLPLRTSPDGRGMLLQCLAIAIGWISWLPWLPVMLSQAQSIYSNYWIFDLATGGMLYEVWKLFWAYSLSDPGSMIASMLVTFAWLILGTWYLFIKWPASRPANLWEFDWPTSRPAIALLAFGPALMAIVVSFAVQPIFLFRPLIGITPFLYLVCAYPLGIIDSTRSRIFAACFIVPLIFMGIGGYYLHTPEQKEMDGTGNMQAGIDYIDAHWQPGDLIFDSNDLAWINLTPYTDLPQYSNPICEERFLGGISTATHDALGIQSREIDQLPPHNRIWFIGAISPMLRECEVARTKAIIGARAPSFVMQNNKLLLWAIWLIDKE